MEVLLTFFQHLLDPAGFPPRWYCGTGWLPFTGWFMVISDLLIFGAYISILLLLLFFVSKRKDILFPRIFWLFAAFIFACGVSHLLDAIMFWWPVYRLTAFERFITAMVSWGTVVALIPIIPKALSLKSPAELEREIQERKAAEARLTELNENLEQIVAERTSELNEKAWQLEAANKELESFSYSVSHDLKAPLRKIQQFSELIQHHGSDNLDAELQQYLERLSGNASHMNQLIEDLLAFSRASRFEMKREPVDLAEMGRELAQDFQEQTPDHPVEFIAPQHMQATGDPTLLRTVLQNLIGNAWKYTSKTQSPRIELGTCPGNDGQPTYFVKDNGIGFDMTQVDRLFRPFQRLVNRQEFPGTGIGLANVQRIVSRHGGRVWAEGQPDQGATFYFSLPE